MVGIALAFASVVREQNAKLDSIDQRVEELKPKLQIENVIGNEELDKFYEISGKRVYLEIDGKPAEEYFKSAYNPQSFSFSSDNR
jgi:hypothetical protein